ncbi:uncharacterized protein B0I36DRAFT_384271 [Microdochium trichocladiopsis]|uniref:Mid2 domain-containing protein n=1 Tax=Microdochium trichocladiopsis TaxID=1682393 RepID=A0A9P9BUJ4_9PEZI|nr:uncharacterized protein B0I36DRAFT_384271 [Microdochium trichocladiopsis]KAH7031504.1 hypothetical protein B0I36DRAFT_384271 [Microdochium trichocladiopsis]
MVSLKGLAGLSAVLASAAAQVAGFDNKFLFPDSIGEVYSNGYVMNVKWQSNYTSPTLTMWCRAPGSTEILMKYQSSTNVPSNNGTKAVTIDLVNIDGCWFQLSTQKEAGFNSNSWKLANNGAPISASSTASTTAPPPESSTASTSTTPTPPPAADSSSPSTPGPDAAAANADLSPGAKGGLGAGIAIAALLAIVGAALLVLARRKMQAAQQLAGQYQDHEAFQQQQQQQQQTYYPPQGSADGRASMYVQSISTHTTGQDGTASETRMLPASLYGHPALPVSPEQQQQQQYGWPEMAMAPQQPLVAELSPGQLFEMPGQGATEMPVQGTKETQ